MCIYAWIILLDTGWCKVLKSVQEDSIFIQFSEGNDVRFCVDYKNEVNASVTNFWMHQLGHGFQLDLLVIQD